MSKQFSGIAIEHKSRPHAFGGAAQMRAHPADGTSAFVPRRRRGKLAGQHITQYETDLCRLTIVRSGVGLGQWRA